MLETETSAYFTAYPFILQSLSTIRLKNISGLQNEFPEYPIGFSDHQ